LKSISIVTEPAAAVATPVQTDAATPAAGETAATEE
jgi:hypothetical protein